MPEDFFRDKVAIVTGASSGIGESVARLLSERGAKIVLAARRIDRLKNLSKELPGSLAVPTDVTDEQSVNRLIRKTMDSFGRIDILINNAGVLLYKPILESDTREIRYVTEVNFFGAVSCARGALSIMKKQGSGVIVNVSSIAGRVAFPNLGYYAASKFALTGFTEALRQEVGKDGIFVCAVNPGTVRTDMTRKILEEAAAKKKNVMPISPERVARAVLWAIEKRKIEVFVPFATRVLYWMHVAFPRFTEWLAWHFRASDPEPRTEKVQT